MSSPILYLVSAGKLRVVYSAASALRALKRARLPMQCKRVDSGAIVGEADGKGGYTFDEAAASLRSYQVEAIKQIRERLASNPTMLWDPGTGKAMGKGKL